MAGKTGTNGSSAPDYDAVEALAHPRLAIFTDDVVQQAHAALREKLTADGLVLTPTDALRLEMLEQHGRQLVKATTPVEGDGK